MRAKAGPNARAGWASAPKTGAPPRPGPGREIPFCPGWGTARGGTGAPARLGGAARLAAASTCSALRREEPWSRDAMLRQCSKVSSTSRPARAAPPARSPAGAALHLPGPCMGADGRRRNEVRRGARSGARTHPVRPGPARRARRTARVLPAPPAPASVSRRTSGRSQQAPRRPARRRSTKLGEGVREPGGRWEGRHPAPGLTARRLARQTRRQTRHAFGRAQGRGAVRRRRDGPAGGSESTPLG